MADYAAAGRCVRAPQDDFARRRAHHACAKMQTGAAFLFYAGNAAA
ncbi:MAG: hypothetical protein ACLR07_00115 [Christensenellales bacterium]